MPAISKKMLPPKKRHLSLTKRQRKPKALLTEAVGANTSGYMYQPNYCQISFDHIPPPIDDGNCMNHGVSVVVADILQDPSTKNITMDAHTSLAYAHPSKQADIYGKLVRKGETWWKRAEKIVAKRQKSTVPRPSNRILDTPTIDHRVDGMNIVIRFEMPNTQIPVGLLYWQVEAKSGNLPFIANNDLFHIEKKYRVLGAIAKHTLVKVPLESWYQIRVCFFSETGQRSDYSKILAFSVKAAA